MLMEKYLIGINLRWIASIALTLKCIALFGESDRADAEQGRKRVTLSIHKHITFEYDMKGQHLWTLLFKCYKRYSISLSDAIYRRYLFIWTISISMIYRPEILHNISASLSTNKSMHKMSSAIANKVNCRYRSNIFAKAKIIDNL